jgi:hypothetical protein
LRHFQRNITNNHTTNSALFSGVKLHDSTENKSFYFVSLSKKKKDHEYRKEENIKHQRGGLFVRDILNLCQGCVPQAIL